MTWDSVIMVDWSSGNDTGPTPRKDAIWLGAVLDGVEQAPEYLRNRNVAEARIADLIETELQAKRRLLLGFDFPFGYPAGFAKVVTGKDDPLALWDWFAAHLVDTPKHNNRFALAGELNRLFPGIGPFWFNALKDEISDLPRKGTARRGHGMAEKRRVEEAAKGAFALWQMGGAGAVGGQAMTGVAVLSRLRARFEDHVAVWPFQPLDRSVAFVEIWPSLIANKITPRPGEVKDCAQVRVLARAVAELAATDLAKLLNIDAPEEGWILGVGHAHILAEAA